MELTNKQLLHRTFNDPPGYKVFKHDDKYPPIFDFRREDGLIVETYYDRFHDARSAAWKHYDKINELAKEYIYSNNLLS